MTRARRRRRGRPKPLQSALPPIILGAMNDRIRIAIMDAVPKIYWDDDEGITDGEKFHDLLAAQNPSARLDIFYATEGEFPDRADAYDAYLISGSPASVHDDLDWIARLSALIVDADASSRRIVASCFGHQLVARIFGGEVGYNEHGWCIGNYRLEIASGFDWMDPPRSATSLYHFNQERVTRLPAGAHSFANSEQYPDFAYTLGDNILSLQGHPEQPLRAMNNFMKSLESRLPVDQLERARRMIANGEPDAEVWGRWMMRFFLAGGVS